MADNAAQAIKDLQKNLADLDVSLDKALKNNEKYTQMLAKTFQDAAEKGKVSIDELITYIGKKTKQVSAQKIQWQIDLGFGKKEVLGKQIESLNKDIEKYTKAKDTSAVTLLKKQLAELKDEYKQLEAVSKKSAAQLYDDMLKIVNAAAGTKKDSKGTAWSKARADLIKENLNTTKKIAKEEERIVELEKQLGNYKEGSKNWNKTKKEIEDVNKQLQQYKDKLNRLQGRKVVDASAKALQDQEQNFRTLNRLLNERRKLEAQIKAQGGATTEVQARYQQILNTSIKQTVASMRKLGERYNDVTRIAAQNTMADRMRRTKTTIDQINSSLLRTRANLDSLTPSLYRIGSALGVAFSLRGLAQFGKKLIETRGEFEMQFVAMKQIIGDVDAATKIWSQTMQMALQSPFKAMQLVDYTKKLAAYRIETEKLFDTTKRLADVSAGLGVDMQRLILAYGQVKAANYLRASEVRQFTEAGVNILGELAEYLTAVNGKMYTTATVMEMITKRMIKFEDVEAIFKRMTDEGGVFFNMQEVQVDTVRGQMMKLQDAFDQMLNKIGSANQGTLREFIDTLNSMVRNWQTFATFLKTNATLWLPVISVMKLAQAGLAKYGDTIVSVAAAEKGKTVQMKASLVEETLLLNKNAKTITAWGYTTRMAIFKVEMAWKALSAAFKAFLPFVIVEGIVYIASAIANANKELDEFRDSINDFASDAESRLGETKTRFKELREELEKTTEGTEARREAVQKMNSQFGKYLNNLVSETMTLEELRAAYAGVEEKMVNIANLRLREEIKNKSSEQVKNIMQDLIEDMEGENIFHFNVWKWDKEHTGLEKTGELSKKQAIGLTSAFVQALQDSVESLGRGLTKEEMEDLALATYNKYLSQNIQEYSDNIDILSDLVQKGRKINSLLSEEMPVIGFDVYKEGESWKTGERQWRDYLAQQKAAFDTFKEQLDENIDNIEEYRKLLNEEIDKYDADIAKYAKSLAVTTGYAPQAFSFRNFYYEVEPFDKNKIPQSTAELEQLYYQKGLRALKEMYPQALSEYSDDYAKAAKIILASTKDLEEGSQKYEETVKKEYKTEKEYLDWLKSKGDASEEEIAQQEALIKIYEKWADIRDVDLSDDKKGRGKAISNMISLIKEMRAEYDKLSKSAYGYAKSEDEVRKSYEKAVREILGKAGVSTSYDFTTNAGMIAALKKVQDFAKTLKDGDEAAKLVEKVISSLSADIGINVEVRNREDFAREIEKMFSDYELTLELQKLNISPSAAKNLFPELDYKTMGDLQDRMHRFYQEQVEAGGFDEKDLETYRKFADKIDAEILKERKDRAKQYSKFLEQEYSERAKVEMQYAQDVAFVTTNFEDSQRENILAGLHQKFSKDISELNWKSFKESDFYLDMMEDLSSLPKDYLDMMLKKIEQVLTENKDGLSPKTLKEIVKARQRVLDAQIKLRPLDVMRSSIEGIRDASKDKTVGGDTWRATNKNLKENIKLQAEQIAQFDEEILSLQKLQGELAGYEEQTARFKAISSRIDLGVLNSLLGLGEGESVTDIGTMEISDITSLIERLTAGLDKAKKAYDPAQKTDEMNKLAVEISQREIMIKLLGEELEIRREMSEYQLSPQAVEAMGQGQTSAVIGAQISEVEGKKGTTEKRQLKFKEWLKSFDNFGEAYKELNKNINNTITSVANAGSAFYDMFEALGGETDALTEGWKEFGSTMINTITQALTMIPTMVDAFVTAGTAINAALGIIGLIAEALQLLFVAIGAIAKLHDSQYEKEIEEQQKRIDELKRAYDRLDKSIEKTWDTMSYIRDYNDMIYNLEQQRDALNKQIAAEEKKKDTDSDKLQGYKDSIQEIDDQLEELKQKQIEVFGGLGEVNYRSVAQEFVDAWKDAFLETGDGLQGLQDHFDEFLSEWFVKQATMRIAGKMLDPLFKDIDSAVDQYSAGGTNVLMNELDAIRQKFGVIAPDLSAALEQLAGMWGLGAEGGLSGLAAGIQGMSEEQANVLEAYWNSVRGYAASIDINVSRIADMLGANSNDITNPQLQQLQLIAHNTASIQRMFESVVMRGHTRGQSGIRVFVD